MNTVEQSSPVTDDERSLILRFVAQVDPDVQRSFESTFAAWKGRWFTGGAKASSDSRSNKTFPEYRQLVAIGTSILPLVVRELADPVNFVALVLYDELAGEDLRVDADERGVALEGEQSRARRTIRRYINYQLKRGTQVPTYTLTTGFADEDLKRFYATGTNIVIAKPTDGGQPNVAWVVYRPLPKNAVTWEEQYGIYASNSEIQNGAALYQLAQTAFPAIFEKAYNFDPSGFFTGPFGGGSKNAYTAVNLYGNLPKGYMTMGLFQNATVDGSAVVGNAVSAALVLYQSKATITPFTTVYLWTQSQVKGNTVVTDVTSAMTKVQFGGGISTVNLQYDPFTGTFIPVADSVALVREGGLTITSILPPL
ncbi:MAG: hypothetical protein ACLQF1_03595 [Methyloceanibacter sp.]